MSAVESWTTSEVVSFITSLGGSAAKYANAFRDNDVSGGLLIQLEDSDLEELGVSNALHKKKILKAIKKAVGENPSSIVLQKRLPGSGPPPQPGEKRVPERIVPEMTREMSEGVSDTPQAILKSALTGCLLSLSSSDEDSVMNMMAMILGNKELSENDKQFVRVELSKRGKESNEEVLKQDPVLAGSSPAAGPVPVPASPAGELDLIQENAHLKEVIEVKDKTIAKLKKKIETLIRTQLEDITDVAEDNIAGRSALKKSATQLNMLQEQLNMKHQSFEEIIKDLKNSQLLLTQRNVEIEKLKADSEQKQLALQTTLAAKIQSEQRVGELNNMIEMMQEEMEAELKENEAKVESMKKELDGKSQVLATMIAQNAKLQEQAQKDAGTSEELEKANKELLGFKTRVSKLTAEVDEMKAILQIKNSDLTEARQKSNMLEQQVKGLGEQLEALETEMMTHKELSAEAAVRGKELEEVQKAKATLETSYAEQVSRVTQLSQAIAMKDIKIAELNQTLSEKEKELEQKMTEVSAQVNAMVTLTQEKLKLEQELAETSSKLSEVETGFDANKAQLEAQMIALTETIDAMASEHETAMEEKNNIHSAQLFAKQKELDATKESLKTKTDSEQLLQATVASLSTESSSKNEKISALQMELQQKGSVEEALSEENDALTSQIQVLQTTVASMSTQVQSKTQELRSIEVELRQKATVEDALSSENESLNTQVQDLTARLGAKISSETNLRNELNTEKAMRQSEQEQLRRENASLQRQVQEMQSTVQVLSESAVQQEEEMTTKIKSLKGTVAQSQADLLSTQTLMTQHKIQSDQLRKELDDSKSVGKINLMQKDEIISEKSNALNQLKGEYESLKTIIKEMNDGSIRSRERHQQELQANTIQLSEKEQQIAKLQKSIREFAEKAKSEQQNLREQLQISISETNDARRQVQESTERYQLANQELRARQMEVDQLKQVIQAQSTTIQEQNKSLGLRT